MIYRQHFAFLTYSSQSLRYAYTPKQTNLSPLSIDSSKLKNCANNPRILVAPLCHRTLLTDFTSGVALFALIVMKFPVDQDKL